MRPEPLIRVNVKYLCRKLKILHASGSVNHYSMVIANLSISETDFHKVGVSDIQDVKLTGLEPYRGEAPGIIYDGSVVTLEESEYDPSTWRLYRSGTGSLPIMETPE